MTDHDVELAGLNRVVQLIARAADTLATDRSAAAVTSEIQARAAVEALEAVGAIVDHPVANDAHTGAAADLVEAEQALMVLPAAVRGQVPVCAAAAFLRRARRELARP